MRQFTLSACLVLTSCLWLVANLPAANGQESQAARSGRVGRLTATGRVEQPSRQPVSGATVTLRSGASPVLRTTTDEHGGFTFRNVPAEDYTLAAETETLRSVPVVVPAGKESNSYTRLVLTLPVSKEAAPRDQSMTFSDEPDFVVSGVTDWTAVGGHGSDATLRTSEDLARATSALTRRDSAEGSSSRVEESKLRDALAANPRSVDANLAFGEYYLSKEDYRQALTLVQGALAIDGQRSEAHYDLALACRGLNDLSQATLHIERALALKDTAEYHRLAGELAEQQGEPYAAVQHMERATLLNPSEDNYFDWGSELLLHRAVVQAGEIFRRAANTYPSSARLQTGWGSALFAEAHYDEASKRLCAASDLQPQNTSPYLLLGRIDEAAPAPLPCVQERLARFLDLSPDNPEASYLYGMSLLRRTGKQNPDDAEKLLKQVVNLKPAHAAALLQLGILAAARQQYDDAINLYRKAIAADPEQPEAHFRLAVAYDRTGQSKQAAAERALHKSIKLRDAEAVEQQRRTVKQFLIVLQQPSTAGLKN